VKNINPDNTAPSVFLNYPDKRGLGGVTRFYASLENQYSQSAYKVEYFRVGRSYARCILKYFPFRYLDTLFRYLLFSYRIKQRKPSILHVNPSTDRKSIIRDSIFVRICRLLSSDTKILVHFRGWNDRDVDNFNGSDFLANSARYLISNADHIIVLAEKFSRVLSNFENSGQISVIPTTVNTRLFDHKPKTSTGFKGTQVLFLSRMIREKGVFEIVQAIKQLSQLCEEGKLRFLLAGDGSAREQVIAELERHRLIDYVSIPGYLTGKQKLTALAESSIFLLPSYSEGCPNSLLEAMAAGLAIIATDVGAIGEIIETGINGLIIPPGDHTAIGKAIKNLLANNGLREQIGKYNSAKVKSIADVTVVFSLISDIYDLLLSKH